MPDAPSEPRVLYDKDIGKAMRDYRQKKPLPTDPYWLAQPSGPFTKEEIFTLCAYIGLMTSTAVLHREKGKAADRFMLELFSDGRRLSELAKRDPALPPRVLSYATAVFEEAAALSPDEAKARRAGFPEGREFVEFNRSNIKSCYATLGAWK